MTFEYDASGRIHVRATEMTFRNTAAVHLRRDSRMDQEELEELTEMVAETDVK